MRLHCCLKLLHPSDTGCQADVHVCSRLPSLECVKKEGTNTRSQTLKHSSCHHCCLTPLHPETIEIEADKKLSPLLPHTPNPTPLYFPVYAAFTRFLLSFCAVHCTHFPQQLHSIRNSVSTESTQRLNSVYIVSSHRLHSVYTATMQYIHSV